MYSCEPPGVHIAQPTSGPWRLYAVGTTTTLNLSTCGQIAGTMRLGFNNPSGYGEMPANSFTGFELPATELNSVIGIVRVKSWVTTDLESAPQLCDLCYQVVLPESTLGPDASAFPRGSSLPLGYTSPTLNPPAAVHRLGVRCGDGAAGGPCRTVNRPNLVIYGTETDLTESVAPSGTVDGGALASVGTKAGTATLSFTAHDGQSGVERVQVLLDGVVAGLSDASRNVALPLELQGAGACAYTGLGACPSDRSGDIDVDTAKVPDGVHAIVLRIIDAAGNQRDVAGPWVTISNGAPVGAPNGASASRTATLTARFSTTTKRSTRVGYRAHPLIKGRLVDRQRRPIAGASITVLARVSRAGARNEQIDTVTTAADGRFSYRLTAGPSRRVTFAYTAFSGDRTPAARTTLRTLVRAAVSATASPRSPAVGQRFTIRGRLRLLPRAGIQVTIQVNTRGIWRPIGNVKTKASGRYTWRYRFGSPAAHTAFSFRAHVDSPIYPFAPSDSAYMRVRVR
jgi:hypothetical protein